MVRDAHAGRVRAAQPDELPLLPPLEKRADEMFTPLGIWPLPEPGTVQDLADAQVVLVAGDPPEGFARLDVLRTAAGAVAAPGSLHLEQLSVDPDRGRRGVGRALLRAAVAWATEQGYGELTLATYRDVPWNGPFYASEGFVETAAVDDWYVAHGLEPEEEVMRRGGTRVLMTLRLRP
jgi:GNAT superfamily N-acetyltransferase